MVTQFLLEETIGEKLFATRLDNGFIFHQVNLHTKEVDTLSLSDEMIKLLFNYKESTGYEQESSEAQG